MTTAPPNHPSPPPPVHVASTVTAAGRGVVTDVAFRRFMRGWATGVAVVTGLVEGRPIGCTVNSLTSVSLNPPLLLVSLSESSRTLAAITARGRFGVNMLSWQQRHLAERFATSDDRFAEVPCRLVSDVPLLREAMATAVCVVDRLIVAADHVLVLGRPQQCHSDGGADPVVFFDGRYQAVCEPKPG